MLNIGAACTIIFLIAAAIWLFKEWCDPGYQAQQQWKRETQKTYEDRKIHLETMKNRLLADGYRTVEYEICDAVEKKYFEDLKNEIESTIKMLGCDYYPLRADFPDGLCNDLFLYRLHHSGARCLFHKEKIITNYNLNFGPWPDVAMDERKFQYYLSVCKYALMSNKDFEKVIGRKLTFNELVDRKPLIDILVPSTDLDIISCNYPIRYSRDKYSREQIMQTIFIFYGGDTGSAEDDFK